MVRHARTKKVTAATVIPQWWVPEVVPLAAQGYGAKAISTRIRRPKATIENVLKHPKVAMAVAKYQEAMWAKGGEQLAAMLLKDAPRNLAFLQEVRDNVLSDGRQAEVRDSVQASTRLMDSVLSRKTASQQQIVGHVQHQHAIVAPEDALDIMVLAEQAGITLPALEPPAVIVTDADDA